MRLRIEIKVVISTPSDAVKERDILLNHLETRFKSIGYAEVCDKILSVVGWEVIPPQAGHPQNLINEALIKDADIIVAVFRHRLGTPIIEPKDGKIRALSGTVEELMKAFDIGKSQIAMAYFFEEPPRFTSEEIESEWKRLNEFKIDIRDRMIYRLYSSEEDLLNTVCLDIFRNIREMRLPLAIGALA